MKSLQERVFGVVPPAHWSLRKFKHIFRVRKGNKNQGLRETNLLSLSYGAIVQKDIESMEGLVPESYEGYQIVEPGDIVLRLTDLQNDKRSLRQGLVRERGIITSAYDAVYTPSDDDVPEYWFYFLYALDLCKYYYSLGGGVRQSIKFGDFPNEWVFSPPKAEQQRIVNGINRSLAACDEIIRIVGGNRAAQVAEDNTLLSVIMKRKNAIIVQSIAMPSETCGDAYHSSSGCRRYKTV